MVEFKNKDMVSLVIRGGDPVLVDREVLAQNMREFNTDAKRIGSRPGQSIDGMRGKISTDVLAAVFTVYTKEQE